MKFFNKEKKEKKVLTEEEKLERKAKVKKTLCNVAKTIGCVVAGAALVVVGVIALGSADTPTVDDIPSEEVPEMDSDPGEESSEETTEE